MFVCGLQGAYQGFCVLLPAIAVFTVVLHRHRPPCERAVGCRDDLVTVTNGVRHVHQNAGKPTKRRLKPEKRSVYTQESR